MSAAIVLAAGASTRLGRPKQLVQYEGRTLLRRAADAALEAGFQPVVVVLGAEAERIRATLNGAPVEIVQNPDWSEGIASSIRVAVEFLEREAPESCASVLLMTCDQPRISPEVLRRLRERFDGRPGRMVASEYAGVVGVPALFERSHLQDLAALRGDRGARALLRGESGSVIRVPWPDGTFDVDCPEDLPS